MFFQLYFLTGYGVTGTHFMYQRLEGAVFAQKVPKSVCFCRFSEFQLEKSFFWQKTGFFRFFEKWPNVKKCVFWRKTGFFRFFDP